MASASSITLLMLVCVWCFSATTQASLQRCENVNFTPLGCFHDVKSDTIPRALPHYILNARDNSLTNFQEPWIQWNDKEGGLSEEWLDDFVCKCAKLALSKGFTHIGIQYHGECWAGNGEIGGDRWDRHGAKPTGCFDAPMNRPGNEISKCKSYHGGHLENFVYRISGCDVKYEAKGCFIDKLGDRVLPAYIQNERDWTLSNWNGKWIDWKNWEIYMPNMMCRCAKKAKELGYPLFGLQYFGECWAGNKTTEYNRLGKSEPRGCFSKPGRGDKLGPCDYKLEGNQCGSNLPQCVGTHVRNMVYEIVPEKHVDKHVETNSVEDTAASATSVDELDAIIDRKVNHV